jgi:hypothetical protein
MRKLALSLMVVLGAVACGAGEIADTDTDFAANGDELTAIQKKLVGSWKMTDGSMLGLVLALDGKKQVFVGEQQVWCVRAPCHPVHLDGRWNVSGTKLTLTETGGNKIVHEWSVANDVLTLADTSTHQAVGHLSKVSSFCAMTSDCGLQQVNGSCTGGAVCGADQACAWRCGAAPAGYGDACGSLSCDTRLACETNGQASGTCWPSPSCDPMATQSCGASQACVVDVDPCGGATCQAFGHGLVVGKGYACGGSIGVSCATGLSCGGLPASSVKGGTGTCQ